MIRFDGLSKRFGDRRVLEDFSLTIPEGQTTVLMGYSGKHNHAAEVGQQSQKTSVRHPLSH